MSSLVIIGAQWGDEGKGKITDYLSDQSDVVVRYQGGSNAGHTVVVGNETYKLHVIPTGVLQNKPSIIGAGMVVDPVWFVEEMQTLQAQGVRFDDLIISARAHVVMPYHKYLDELREDALKDSKIGTTKRGIGPAYSDKTNRCGIRMCDLIDEDIFREKLAVSLEIANQEITSVYKKEPMRFEDIFEQYCTCAKLIKPFVADASAKLYAYIKSGKKVLFEGAQGTLLDIDFGTYPYVTSSHPTASGVCCGSGVGPTAIDAVVGIAKAYTTRVGMGPFPTELFDETGAFLRDAGHEFGTTTGRARRCGWLDLVILKYAVRVNGLSGLVLTKIDTLTGLDSIKVCVGYRYNGEIITDFPASLAMLAKCEPVYKEFPGWTEDISSLRSYDELPSSVKDYVSFIEQFTQCEIGIISVGPKRDETIIRKSYF